MRAPDSRETALPSDDPFKLGAPPVPELRLSDSVSSGSGDKSPNYDSGTRDRAREWILQGGCATPIRGLRWERADGKLYPLPCGRSNKCSYCAARAAIEAALVLKLDAELCMPTVGITTTTRSPGFSHDDLKKAEKDLWRALREGRRIGRRAGRRSRDERRYPAFPDLRYCGFLEWTTGKGTHAGGWQRPHIHHLVKGIPDEDGLLEPRVVDDAGTVRTPLEERISELWQSYTGDAFVVECRRLRTPVGAIHYLALHHRKKGQGPPPGFSGRRLRPSREVKPSAKNPLGRKGYYERPVKELRELARRLASSERVQYAASRAVSAELHGRDEFDTDEQMTSAIVGALRDMAERPLELQVELLSGDVDYDIEHAEFVSRVAVEVERIRSENPPRLVRVLEMDRLDPATGFLYREAVAVLGELNHAEREVVLALGDAA